MKAHSKQNKVCGPLLQKLKVKFLFTLKGCPLPKPDQWTELILCLFHLPKLSKISTRTPVQYGVLESTLTSPYWTLLNLGTKYHSAGYISCSKLICHAWRGRCCMFKLEHKCNTFALDDEAVPFQQQLPLRGLSSSHLFMLELAFVWLHQVIYLTHWAEKSSFSSCWIVLACMNSLTCSPQSQDKHQRCSEGNGRRTPKWEGKKAAWHFLAVVIF